MEEKLLSAGFKTVESVARTTAEKLSKGARISKKTARASRSGAKHIAMTSTAAAPRASSSHCRRGWELAT